MFTGIIEQKAKLTARKQSTAGLVLQFQTEKKLDGVALGESIAMDGACLTVVQPFSENQISFDLSPETLEKTKFGALELGDWVNLERAMPANGRFSGHVVSGHVDGVGKVTVIQSEGDYRRIQIEVPHHLAAFCISKGSISVNGISLTINAIDENRIELMIIPHTLEVTTLGQLAVGASIHLECDLFAKLFVKHMQGQGRPNEIHS